MSEIDLDAVRAALENVKPQEDPDPVLYKPGTVDLLGAVESRQAREEGARGHLGMSEIGEPDARTLWLKFRWCLPDEPGAQLHRLFRLGDLIETDFINQLQAALVSDQVDAGLTRSHSEDFRPALKVMGVNPQTGDQFRFSELGGHFSGSSDGFGLGLPEVPAGEWCVLEYKSANATRFREFQKNGVKETEIKYWAQVQCYMAKGGVRFALFLIYNKNNSEVYAELIELDENAFPAFKAKAESIICDKRPPASTYPNRNWYEIKKFKSDEYQAVYWCEELPHSVNCRNCVFGTAWIEGENAPWICDRHHVRLDMERQRKGCENHRWNPALVPLEFIREDGEDFIYRAKDGREFTNADAGVTGDSRYSSAELAHLSRTGFSDSLTTGLPQELRDTFGAELIHAEPIKTED